MFGEDLTTETEEEREEREERERWARRWAILEKACAGKKHQFRDSERAKCAEMRMIDHVASGDMPDYL